MKYTSNVQALLPHKTIELYPINAVARVLFPKLVGRWTLLWPRLQVLASWKLRRGMAEPRTRHTHTHHVVRLGARGLRAAGFIRSPSSLSDTSAGESPVHTPVATIRPLSAAGAFVKVPLQLRNRYLLILYIALKSVRHNATWPDSLAVRGHSGLPGFGQCWSRLRQLAVLITAHKWRSGNSLDSHSGGPGIDRFPVRLSWFSFSTVFRNQYGYLTNAITVSFPISLPCATCTVSNDLAVDETLRPTTYLLVAHYKEKGDRTPDPMGVEEKGFIAARISYHVGWVCRREGVGVHHHPRLLTRAPLEYRETPPRRLGTVKSAVNFIFLAGEVFPLQVEVMSVRRPAQITLGGGRPAVQSRRENLGEPVRGGWSHGALVVRLLAKANRVQSPAGSLRIFASGNRAGRCHWLAYFLGDLSPPFFFHSGAAPYSPHFTLIGSQYLHVKSLPNLFTLHSLRGRKGKISVSIIYSFRLFNVHIFKPEFKLSKRRRDGLNSTPSQSPTLETRNEGGRSPRRGGGCWEGRGEGSSSGKETSEERPGSTEVIRGRGGGGRCSQTSQLPPGVLACGLLFMRNTFIVGATVAEHLAFSPPTKAIRAQSPAGSLRILARVNRDGRCRWSAGPPGDLPLPAPLHTRTAQIFSLAHFHRLEIAMGQNGNCRLHLPRSRGVKVCDWSCVEGCPLREEAMRGDHAPSHPQVLLVADGRHGNHQAVLRPLSLDGIRAAIVVCSPASTTTFCSVARAGKSALKTIFLRLLQTTTVAERLARSPPTKANRAHSPAGSLGFRKWESCRTMPLVSGFSRGSPVSSTLSFRRHSIFTPITLIVSEDHDVKCRPNSPESRKLHERDSTTYSGIMLGVRSSSLALAGPDSHPIATRLALTSVDHRRLTLWPTAVLATTLLVHANLHRNPQLPLALPSSLGGVTDVFAEGVAATSRHINNPEYQHCTVFTVEDVQARMSHNKCDRYHLWQACLSPEAIQVRFPAGVQPDASTYRLFTTAPLSPRCTGFNPRPGDYGFSQVGIAPDDTTGRRVFSGISRFPHPIIPALPHTHRVRWRSGNSLDSHSGGYGLDSRSGHPDFGFPWFSEITPGECWDESLTMSMAESSPNPFPMCSLHRI
ncbi:hypothetical protein PR048_004633 [Dryococelus australis]|uniref:Uncharacterized protein n=1 Tax=Dryococelus australis TaxID=614101 RepID=A0ABQ9I728_9NEOP|nr:hypothetical protein PR048_004633 [Dryococelus australis]